MDSKTTGKKSLSEVKNAEKKENYEFQNIIWSKVIRFAQLFLFYFIFFTRFVFIFAQ